MLLVSKLAYFFEKRANPSLLFVHFRSFQTQILQKNGVCQLDSNLDRRSRR